MTELPPEVRLALLEQEMEALKQTYERDMKEIKLNLQTLLLAFSSMTGGQKAWFSLAATLGAVVGAIAACVAIMRGINFPKT